MSSNLSTNDASISAIATMYTPAVLIATNRTDQAIKHSSEDEYQAGLEEELHDDLGLNMDWGTGKLFDSRGNYYRDIAQLNYLTFLISLSNAGWPCNSVLVSTPKGGTNPLFGNNISDFPCYIPDITHLEEEIFLLNARGDTLKPTVVRGRLSNWLTMEETLIAKFSLRNGDHHFLQGSEHIQLLFTSFSDKIRLKFDVSLLNFANPDARKLAPLESDTSMSAGK
jgi:hypothetical protein